MESGTPGLASEIPELILEERDYIARFARSREELDAALRLRYEVFNVELGEGLAESRKTGRDLDVFDAQCHHLIVEHGPTGKIVGTYRMQTVAMAALGRGCYSAGEFDLSGMPPDVMSRSVELGRACVAREYRNARVLHLLWRGLAAYVVHTNNRYLFGCSSLTTLDPAEGMRALRALEKGRYTHPDFWVETLPEFTCPPCNDGGGDEYRFPRLFRSYLDIGTLVCGGPALDRAFQTTDFLVVLDIEQLDDRVRARYF